MLRAENLEYVALLFFHKKPAQKTYRPREEKGENKIGPEELEMNLWDRKSPDCESGKLKGTHVESWNEEDYDQDDDDIEHPRKQSESDEIDREPEDLEDWFADRIEQEEECGGREQRSLI